MQNKQQVIQKRHIYTYIQRIIHTYMHASIHPSINTYIQACTYTSIILRYTHTGRHTCIQGGGTCRQDIDTIYTYKQACIHKQSHTHRGTCKTAYMYTYWKIQTRRHTYNAHINSYMHTSINTSIHTYIQRYIQAGGHTYMHTYIQTNIHTYHNTGRQTGIPPT